MCHATSSVLRLQESSKYDPLTQLLKAPIDGPAKIW